MNNGLKDRYGDLKRRLIGLARGRGGTSGLFVAAALESSIVPFPVELFLVPAVLWQRDRAWLLTTAALLGCVLASVVFYGVGWLLYEELGRGLASYLGIAEDLRQFERDLKSGGFWLVAGISFFPLPLQVATLGSGAFGYSFPLFLAAIVITRAARFYGVTLLAVLLGRPVLRLFRDLHPAWRLAAVAGSLAIVVLLYRAL